MAIIVLMAAGMFLYLCTPSAPSESPAVGDRGAGVMHQGDEDK